MQTRRRSIRAKLLLLVLVVGLVTAGLVTAALIQMKRVKQEVTEAVSVSGEKVRLAWQAKEAILEAAKHEQNLILARSLQERSKLNSAIAQEQVELREALSQLEPLLDSGERDALRELRELWAEWENYLREIRRLDLLGPNAEDARITPLMTELRNTFEQFSGGLSSLLRRTASLEDSSGFLFLDPQIIWMTERRSTLLIRLRSSLRRIPLSEDTQAVAIAMGSTTPNSGALSELLKEIERDLKLLDAFIPASQRAEFETVYSSFLRYAELQQRFLERIANSSAQSAYTIFSRLSRPLEERATALMSRIIERNGLKMQQSQVEAEKIFQSSQLMFLVTGIVGVMLATLTAAWTAKGISRQLELLRAYLKEVQLSGDLSTKVPQLGQDEIGDLAMSFEHMRKRLFKKKVELSQVNRRLTYANRKLQDKRSEMEQFVYTVSHDLKSPLVTCKGFIGVLQEELEEDQREDVIDAMERIDGACDSMNHIIDNLLELNRLTVDTEEPTELDTVSLIEELRKDFAPRLNEFAFELEVQGDLPTVYARRTMFLRCFENLLSNAIKYGGAEGRSKISIAGKEQGAEVWLSISDQGQGIDPKYHQSIFRLFHRLDTTLPGTGIGLASVERIMQLHHGRVWLESEKGRGTTFWLAFPSRGSNEARMAAM